jgi:hypothetical protein
MTATRLPNVTRRGLSDEMTDTDSEIERRLVEIYRRMSVQEKWHRLGELFDAAEQLAAAGTRLRNPRATDSEVHNDWLARTVGRSRIEAHGELPHATR